MDREQAIAPQQQQASAIALDNTQQHSVTEERRRSKLNRYED